MFTGFSPETIDFLWGIRMNNNRDWFAANKKQYTDYLYQPMKELGKELFQPFLDRPGNILKVSRIYRDARMHPPEPYKESLWICIRQDVEWWAENPCLYFEINPDRVHYGFFFYRVRPQLMETIRRDMVENPDRFLKMIRKVEKDTGIPVTADEQYKRPKPTDNPKLEPYFAWKGQIGCVAEETFNPETFGPELGERVKKLITQLMPLYDYFCKFTQQ